MAMYLVIFKDSAGMTRTHLTRQDNPHKAIAHAEQTYGELDEVSVYTVQPCDI